MGGDRFSGRGLRAIRYDVVVLLVNVYRFDSSPYTFLKPQGRDHKMAARQFGKRHIVQLRKLTIHYRWYRSPFSS